MKVFKLVFGIFGGVGVLLLAIGIFSYIHTVQWTEKAEKTQGTVIRLSTYSSDGTFMYTPVIRFKDHTGNTTTFRSNTSSSSPAYQTGENVTVLYPADRPEKAKIKSFFSLWGITLIVGGMGLVFTLMGGGFLWFLIRKKQLKKWLKQHGKRITTDYQDVVTDTSTMVQGRCPYRIISQWEEPGTRKIYVFRSDEIWFDPTAYINRDYIHVLIQPGNPQKYMMDTSFLPESGNYTS